MAIRGVKHDPKAIAQVALQFDGGLNLADGPTAVADNQLTQAVNVLYTGAENVPAVRPGLVHVADPPSAVQIVKLHYYVKNTTTDFLVAAMSDGKLYWLDTGTDTWKLVGSLQGSADVPSVVTYNGLMIVADGASRLHFWNGKPATTSTSSVTVGTGAKTFVLADDVAWSSGEDVCIRNGASNALIGTVTSYTAGTKTLVVDVVTAEGTGTLNSWTVEGYVPIVGSPAASAVVEISNRLVCNSSQDLDGVYFSKTEDESVWLTGSGAVFLRAGYRDALQVVGFGVFGSDLLVFKGGNAGKRIYRVNTSGSTSNWFVASVAEAVTATSHNAIAFVGNNILFGSDLGIKDLAGVQQYGDLQVGNLGRNVNPLLNGKTVREIKYISSMGIALVLIAGDYRVLAYHPHNNVWTTLDFQQAFVQSVVQAGASVYVGAQSGKLYRLEASEDTDEMTSGVTSSITSLIRTKMFSFPGEVVIRRSRLYYEAISDGGGTFSVTGRDQLTDVPILTWSAEAGQQMLYDWTQYLNDATWKLGAQTIDYKVSRARVRDQALSFTIKTTSGRFKFREGSVELAAVNG